VVSGKEIGEQHEKVRRWYLGGSERSRLFTLLPEVKNGFLYSEKQLGLEAGHATAHVKLERGTERDPGEGPNGLKEED